MRLVLLTITVALLVPSPGLCQVKSKLPEAFTASAEAKTPGLAAAALLKIHIDRYSTDEERAAAVKALQTGGSAALTAALRQSASAGYVEVATKRWTIRYAREEAIPQGRRIVVVVDHPIFFLGGGELNPKPREGFDLALIQFEVDEIGIGQGTMAAAARIEAGGSAGVHLADYSEHPIKLVMVTKVIS